MKVVFVGVKCALFREGRLRTSQHRSSPSKRTARPGLDAAWTQRDMGPLGSHIRRDMDLAEASLAIKRAAVTLKWPAGLVWDGVHCLRNGGAQPMKMFVSEPLEGRETLRNVGANIGMVYAAERDSSGGVDDRRASGVR